VAVVELRELHNCAGPIPVLSDTATTGKAPFRSRGNIRMSSSANVVAASADSSGPPPPPPPRSKTSIKSAVAASHIVGVDVGVDVPVVVGVDEPDVLGVDVAVDVMVEVAVVVHSWYTWLTRYDTRSAACSKLLAHASK
jgi:hypothetical protein